MKRLFILILAALMLTAASFAEPVEHAPPRSRYQPAFEGQTRAPGMTTEQHYAVRVLAEGLDRPWGLAPLPDGRLLITQRGGSLVIVDQAGQVSAPIRAGLPAVADQGQGGLLDVALPPDYLESGLVYLSFAMRGQGGRYTALGRGRLEEAQARLVDFELLFEALPALPSDAHYGSRIAFESADALYLSTGDRWAADTRILTQQDDTGQGKVFRISGLKGQVRAEMFSKGHRNPQGLAIQPGSGLLFEAEMGPMGGDEVNIIRAGQNYGWPVIGYGLEYSGHKVGQGLTSQDGMAQPLYYWDPSVSPSGMSFYDGDQLPFWRGDLFIGCLSGQHIVRLRLEGERVVGEERLLKGQGQRFRDIAQGADGALYAITDAGLVYGIGAK